MTDYDYQIDVNEPDNPTVAITTPNPENVSIEAGGAKGDRGDTGPAGPAGATGPQGPVGLTGPAGPTGDQGPQGIQGPAGADGAVGPKGDTGDTGPQGPQGIQGPAGNDGAVGPQGPQGDDGDQGQDGADGNTILNGTGNPSSGNGADGDFYFNTATSTLWGPKVAGSWGSSGLYLKGNTVLSGPDVPASFDGAEGDFWINTAVWEIWGPKTSGSWGASGTSLIGSGGGGSAPTGFYVKHLASIRNVWNATTSSPHSTEKIAPYLNYSLPIISTGTVDLEIVGKYRISVPNGGNYINVRFGTDSNRLNNPIIIADYEANQNSLTIPFATHISGVDLSTQHYLSVSIRNGSGLSGIFLLGHNTGGSNTDTSKQMVSGYIVKIYEEVT